MARLNVNPTRMELSKLKTKLVTAKKGHKLLKDKQDELMRIFIETIKQNREMRKRVEEKLTGSLRNFAISKSLISESSFEEAVAVPKISFEVNVTKKNVMSVRIPQLTLEKNGNDDDIYPYSFASTSSELDMAVEDLSNIMNELLKLSEIEKSAQLMADEIEKTRRRVNALEYMTIPTLEETIKFIRMKLDENDRGAIIRLMKAGIKN
ncbi:V-type ATP synthase subunit D [Streptobacillus moniliformis]|uniref:V-type ATP synthase subunit D n=1 Tax=Streptobacillus moniliformis (strain ATCC 14647 / DSM 12112 / NCTC 10651 / 9901) TaxID=519441 RepID=D1AWR7_STRM9|nr:V-type ATP synthase subunit D [Streptobacillus moniliformis]ACZ00743.1 V-type ATPase, D subunit [Streptobacillus moniliformis DSM 12112]AVL42862.1 V-type ATP synthase subunit D [Streptobacillus moniliformis]QXW65496.1 V-type ATP synthase subunit D [Streptobacillus moniliformis]SQA14128.1 V-type sodium pump subunit D [Streptobacillus moniliformis]SQA14952.1 V-type sodium pump subunit D [Streptobacillus moniliformis]